MVGRMIGGRGPDRTYVYTIALNDGTSITLRFGLCSRVAPRLKLRFGAPPRSRAREGSNRPHRRPESAPRHRGNDETMRDARPFRAQHLRQRADEHDRELGVALHRLARWVENLPAGDARMGRIAETDALDYSDGDMVDGAEAAAPVDAYGAEAIAARERRLDEHASAVERFCSDKS